MAYDPWAQPTADWSNPGAKKPVAPVAARGNYSPMGGMGSGQSMWDWGGSAGGLPGAPAYAVPGAGFQPIQAPAQGPGGSGAFAPMLSGANANMDAFLAQPTPQASSPTMQPNRFESALSGSEQRLNALLADPSSIADSPAYKFRVQQQEEALNRQLGAKGLLNSGNRITAIADRGQQLASTEYDAEFARRAGLYGANAGAYNTNEGANTNRYSAEATDANQKYGIASTANTARGNTLADLVKNAGTQFNTAENIASDNALGWGKIYASDPLRPKLGVVAGQRPVYTPWG